MRSHVLPPRAETTLRSGLALRAGAAVLQRAWQVALLCLLGSVALAQGVSGFHGVVLNGMPQPGFVYLVFDDAAHPFMALRDFNALGFVTPVTPVVRDGLEVVPLFGQNGLSARVDANQLTLVLDVEPHWYAGTHLSLNALHAGKPLPATPGILFNYSVQLSRAGDSSVVAGSTQSVSAFGSAGHFLLTTALTSADSHAYSTERLTGRKFSRLGTTFQRDDEERMTSLVVGDGVLSAGVGVPSVRYGGITWQSNFGLNPAFSTLEVPAIFDSARLPSTLEFYLNDRRVGGALPVAPGPFEIGSLPTVDGAGQVKVVIRDALNNERVVVVPYLHTARLYRQGLHSFSYTAGLLRPDLDRYNTPFLASSHRWGLTRWLTLDAGATLSEDHNSLGVGGTFPLFDHVIADARLAMSKSAAGVGHQWGASAQRVVSVASLGGSFSHSSESFSMLGDSNSASLRPRNDLRLFAARALSHDLGSISASYGRLSSWEGSPRTISSVGWSRSFHDFSISATGVRTNGQSSVLVSVGIPLERQAFLSSSLQWRESTTTWRTDYSTAPLTDNGVAGSVGMTTAYPAGGDDVLSYRAALDARSDFGEHGVAVESYKDSLAWRAHTTGSVGMLASRWFYGPPVSAGFALVSTGDATNIPVYRWNLPVAVSNARGIALVTTLTPYQNNLLAVRPEDIPLEYRITSHEVTAVPRSRGGVFVEFAMLREHPALLILQLPDGEAVPPGALVTLVATGETALVGQRGEVYLPNLPLQSEVDVVLKASHCRFTVVRSVSSDPQPRLGPYTCELRRGP